MQNTEAQTLDLEYEKVIRTLTFDTFFLWRYRNSFFGKTSKKYAGESNKCFFGNNLRVLIPTVCLCVPTHKTLEMNV